MVKGCGNVKALAVHQLQITPSTISVCVSGGGGGGIFLYGYFTLTGVLWFILASSLLLVQGGIGEGGVNVCTCPCLSVCH